MKKIIAFLLLLGALPTAAQVAFRPINDWNIALETAKSEGKFIFLDAYTDWCYWCKVQDKELFSQQEVGNFMNENFIPIKINFEDSLGLVLARKFRVWAYPTTLYFNPDGELVQKQPGYTADAQKFIDIGKTAMQHAEGQILGFSSKNLSPNFPDFYTKSLGKRGETEKVEQAMVEAYLEQQTNLFSEESWSVMYRFPIGEKYEKHFVDNFDKYKAIYGKTETEDMLYQTAYYGVMGAAQQKDENTMKKWCDIASQKMETETPQDINDNLRMTYFQKTEEFDKYMATAENKIAREGFENHAFVNSVSWTAYENITDKILLKKAAAWMKNVVANKPEYAYLDTYAALLLKSGDKKNGKKAALKAIEVGKAAGEKTDETEQLLKTYSGKK